MTTSIIHLAVGLVLLVAVNIVLGGLFHRLLHGRLAQPGHHRH